MRKRGALKQQVAVTLLLVALSVSLYGTFVSLSVIDSDTGITGFAPATDTATVNLTVDQILDVNWSSEGVDWGEGSVRPDHTNCTLNMNASGNSAGCTGFDSLADDIIELYNIGNMNVSLNISFDTNASTFVGGTSPAFYFNWEFADDGLCMNTTGAHVSPDRDNIWWGNNSYINSSENFKNWHEVNETGANDYALCKIFGPNTTNPQGEGRDSH